MMVNSIPLEKVTRHYYYRIGTYVYARITVGKLSLVSLKGVFRQEKTPRFTYTIVQQGCNRVGTYNDNDMIKRGIPGRKK